MCTNQKFTTFDCRKQLGQDVYCSRKCWKFKKVKYSLERHRLSYLKFQKGRKFYTVKCNYRLPWRKEKEKYLWGINSHLWPTDEFMVINTGRCCLLSWRFGASHKVPRRVLPRAHNITSRGDVKKAQTKYDRVNSRFVLYKYEF